MRDDILRRVREYAGELTMRDMDSLDWFDLAMQIEEEHAVSLPQYATGLTPPPPYDTPEAFVDAVMDWCHSGGNKQEGQ